MGKRRRNGTALGSGLRGEAMLGGDGGRWMGKEGIMEGGSGEGERGRGDGIGCMLVAGGVGGETGVRVMR